MDCKRFQEILDTGRDGALAAADRAGFDLHAESCPACGETLKTARMLRNAYAGQLPGERKLADFQHRLFTRIDQIAGDAPPPSSGKPLIGLVGAGIGVALLGLILYFFAVAGTSQTKTAGDSTTNPPEPIPASSPAPLFPKTPVAPLLAHVSGDHLRVWPDNGTTATTASTPLSIAQGTPVRVGCMKECRIAFTAGESVEVRGESQFKPEPHGMELFAGQATYTFHAVQGSFNVRMPQAVLAIRGTILGIRILPGEDLVWVEEGVISWEHLRSKASGLLQRGAGMRFRREKAEAWKPVPEPASSAHPATMALPMPGTTTAAALPETMANSSATMATAFPPPATASTSPEAIASPPTDGLVSSFTVGEPLPIKGTDDGF